MDVISDNPDGIGLSPRVYNWSIRTNVRIPALKQSMTGHHCMANDNSFIKINKIIMVAQICNTHATIALIWAAGLNSMSEILFETKKKSFMCLFEKIKKHASNHKWTFWRTVIYLAFSWKLIEVYPVHASKIITYKAKYDVQKHAT